VAGGDRLLRSPADMRSRERDQPTVWAPSVEACVTEGWQAGNGRRAIPCAASCTHGDPIALAPGARQLTSYCVGRRAAHMPPVFS
jgi:hypothetical protein